MTELELLAHHDFVTAIAARLVGDPGTAEDVAQETMFAAWRHRDSPPASLRGWLSACARNFARQFHRGDRRRVDREQFAASPERVPSVHEVVAREERRRAVVAAVLGLEEPYRSAVLLRFYEGLAPRELAKRLRLPIETVRTRLKRGVEQIRARIAREPAAAREGLRAWLAPIAGPLATGSSTGKTVWLVAASLLLAVGTWRLVGGEGRQAVGVADAGPSADGGANAAAEGGKDSPAVVATRVETSHASPAETVATATWTLRGRVTDRLGTPINGANVFAWRDQLEQPIRIQDEGAGSRLSTARTDAEGRFEIAIPIELPRCTVFATAEGRSPGTQLSVERDDEPTILLDENDYLVGVVRDEGGSPIRGARLRSWGMHGGALLEHSAESAPDGSYRLEAPIADRAAWTGDSESWVWWVEVTAKGFAPFVLPQTRALDPEADPGERQFDVTLRVGATVVGKVVDAETKAPIHDARVVLLVYEQWSVGRKVGGTLPNPYGNHVLAEVRSDGRGRFEFRNVPELDPESWGSSPVGLSRPSDPQRVEVVALSPGHSAVRCSVVGPAELTLEMWRSASVVGRVVDREGRAVAGLPIAASVFDAEAVRLGRRRWRDESRACVGDSRTGSVRCDADGRFEVGGIPVGGSGPQVVHLVIERNEQWVGEAEVTVEAVAGETVTAPDLVAVPHPSVIVEVVDSLGRPVPEARVFARNVIRAKWTDADGQVRWFEPDVREVQPDGRTVRTNTLCFEIEKKGFARFVSSPVQTSVDPEPARFRVVLEPGHSIRGRLFDPRGAPVPCAGVMILEAPLSEEDVQRLRQGESPATPNPVLCSAMTTTDGSFELDGLANGSFTVIAMPPFAWRDSRRLGVEIVEDVVVDGPPLFVELPRR